MKKKKILFLAPHLSSGGMPSFLLKRIQLLNSIYDIYVVEYEFVSGEYIVHRKQIQEILGKKFYSLGENKDYIFNIIEKNNIDLIHIEHESEGFDLSLMSKLYSEDRNYKIVETCHNVTFDATTKIFTPDAISFCTPFHFKTFKNVETKKKLIEYPIKSVETTTSEKQIAIKHLGLNPNEYHVLNVGLWTRNKNQGEAIEIAKKHPTINFHFVGNQAGNFSDYWKPLMQDLPSNVFVWGERDDVSAFMLACDFFMFNSLNECNPIVLKEAISYGLPIFAHNLPQYCGAYDDYIYPVNSFNGFVLKRTKTDLDTISSFVNDSVALYDDVISSEKQKQKYKEDYIFEMNFINGVYFEIKGSSFSDFKVVFFDKNKNKLYENTIKCNSWIKLDRQYYTDYTITVYKDNILVYQYDINLFDKRVMISFESSSLGDTIAWLPYCDVFQKKHNCKLIVSTFKNFLFKNQYPNIEFVEPNTVVKNLFAKYDLGWFYNSNKEPVLPNTIPLQQAATNILGLKYKELKPKLNFDLNQDKDLFKSVCIAPNSTSGCKEWELSSWQLVVDYLVSEKYKVYNVSKEQNYKLNGTEVMEDYGIENTMRLIYNADFFIGLSSGLSWLAWALNSKVIMIANFTNPDHEFEENCIRLINHSVCHGCWNNKNFKFDKGDFHWCPINKGYASQFICQKSITPNQVIEEVKKLSF